MTEPKPLSIRARLAKLKVAILPELKAGTRTNFKEIIALPDIQPAFIKASNDAGIYSYGSIEDGVFIYRVSSVDDPADVIEIKLPVIKAEMRGAQAIQNLGGTLTYLTRYALYQVLGISSASEDPDMHEREEQAPASGGYALPFKPLSPLSKPAVDLMDIPEDLPEPTALDRIAEINRFTTVKQLKNYYDSLSDAWKANAEVFQALTNRKLSITVAPTTDERKEVA